MEIGREMSVNLPEASIDPTEAMASLRKTPQQHFQDSIGKLNVARSLRDDHYSGIQKTLAAKDVMAGQQPGASNDSEEAITPDQAFSTEAWRNTIGQFKNNPTG
jgi:hypothetical protein